MTTLDRGKATQRALLAIAGLGAGDAIVLQDHLTIERDFGWVFFPVARRWLETRDRGDLIPGVGAIAVDRTSGVATFLTTSVDPDTAIAGYGQAWRERLGVP